MVMATKGASKGCRFLRCPCCGRRVPCSSLEREHRPEVLLVKGRGKGKGFRNIPVDLQHDPAWMGWLIERTGLQLERLTERARAAGMDVEAPTKIVVTKLQPVAPAPATRPSSKARPSTPSIFDAFGTSEPERLPLRTLPAPQQRSLIRRSEEQRPPKKTPAPSIFDFLKP
jgi:hypothetical protein